MRTSSPCCDVFRAGHTQIHTRAHKRTNTRATDNPHADDASDGGGGGGGDVVSIAYDALDCTEPSNGYICNIICAARASSSLTVWILLLHSRTHQTNARVRTRQRFRAHTTYSIWFEHTSVFDVVPTRRTQYRYELAYTVVQTHGFCLRARSP